MTSAPPSTLKESFYLIPIGETGTGKTTLINSFANYSRYATLDEAIENGPVVLADVGFTYSAAGVRGKSVYLRGSASEVNKEIVDVSGVTHTQGSSAYSIDFNDSKELIFYDSSGFGSQSLLQEEKIKKENIFCFDNDCFRYLCYLAANPGEQSRHHKAYAEEWTKNVEEHKRLISHLKTLTPILHEEVKTSDIAMESTDFRDLLPDSRRAVFDFLIEQEEWPVLKEFISTESQEVQQAFEVIMQSVDKSDTKDDTKLYDVIDNNVLV